MSATHFLFDFTSRRLYGNRQADIKSKLTCRDTSLPSKVAAAFDTAAGKFPLLSPGHGDQ